MTKQEWKRYNKKAIQAMRPYIPGEDLTGVTVSVGYTPKEGDMIARGEDQNDLWLISKQFFDTHYEEV